MSDEDRIDPTIVALAWSFEVARIDLGAGAAPVVVDGLTTAEERVVNAMVRLELEVHLAAAEAALAEHEAARIYLRSVAPGAASEEAAIASLSPTEEMIYLAMQPPHRRGPEALA